jgi:hypothetical protein
MGTEVHSRLIANYQAPGIRLWSEDRKHFSEPLDADSEWTSAHSRQDRISGFNGLNKSSMYRPVIGFLLVLLVMLFWTIPVHADISPPAEPPGANPVPANASTQVRMQSETVLIDVQPSAPSGSLGRAAVTADFTMRNLGTQPETMAARFPISANNGRYEYPEIRDMRVLVDGKRAPSRRITGEDPFGSGDQVPWMEFDVAFPVGRDVQVRVTYTLEASGEPPFAWFRYVLSTGAAWRDTIGSVDLIVRLPYAANDQNVLVGRPDSSIDTTPGGTLGGNEVRWHYDNLEPTKNDNFEVDLVMPAEWGKVLKEQTNVAQNPSDGEAWGRLGRLYKAMAFSSRGKGFRRWGGPPDAGSQELYALSVQAYEKAVSLKPDDALWHAGFADLLAYHAYFGRSEQQNTAGEAVRAMQEIKQALALAPQDQQVKDIAIQISSFFPDGMRPHAGAWDFPWLTATPFPPTTEAHLATETATAPSPTSIAITSALTPGETSPAPPSLPICGGALILGMTASRIKRLRLKG